MKKENRQICKYNNKKLLIGYFNGLPIYYENIFNQNLTKKQFDKLSFQTKKIQVFDPLQILSFTKLDDNYTNLTGKYNFFRPIIEPSELPKVSTEIIPPQQKIVILESKIKKNIFIICGEYGSQFLIFNKLLNKKEKSITKKISIRHILKNLQLYLQTYF